MAGAAPLMDAPLDALILDLDGTLIDSAEDIAAAVDLMLAGRGHRPAGVDLVAGWVGDGASVLVARALAWATGADAPAADTASALADFMAHYEGCCCTHTRLAAGARQLIDAAAAAGVVLAVASNKPERFCGKILAHLGVRDRFAAVIGGGTTPTRKPDALPLREAAKRAGASAPWMVGDSELDRWAASAAQFPFVGVLGGYRPSSPEEIAPPTSREVIGVTLVELAAWIAGTGRAARTFAAFRAQARPHRA